MKQSALPHWLHAFRLRTLPLALSSMVGYILPACTHNSEERAAQSIEPLAPVENIELSVVGPDTLLNLKPKNQADERGQKQGLWITDLRGKPWKRESFKDGQLHGECMEYWANGEVVMTTYRQGVKHGATMHYHPDSSVASLYSWYEDGSSIWTVFPWELATYIVPVKGWSTRRDSVEIRVPYVSGQVLYHGFLNQGAGMSEMSYGIHQAFFPDGGTMALIDYDKDSIRVYDHGGQLVTSTTPSTWRGNRVK